MWKNVYLNIQNISAETAKAMLIKIPKKTKRWGGSEFWISKKCVRSGSHSYEIEIGVNLEWTYKSVTSGREITGQEFYEIFYPAEAEQDGEEVAEEAE